jgi:TolB protein
MLQTMLLPDSMSRWPKNEVVAPAAEETNFKSLRQLTFGGQNAEAYWSTDGKQLVFQSAQPGLPDEQIFAMNADGSNRRMISTGLGRCTCAYFTPNGREIFFSSTHERNPGPQDRIDMSQGYVWMVNPDYALYRTPAARKTFTRTFKNRGLSGKTTGVEQVDFVPVIKKNGYVAEATVAPNGKYMVFTGSWEGDLDIYRANLDGTNIQRLTNVIGYDGGPFVSWDSKKIVYRRQAVTTPEEKSDYLGLLKKNLIRPSKLEIWIMDADGTNQRQVTNLGCASFAPFLHPDGKRIVFSSNYGDPKGREFDIYMINTDGTGLKRITHSPEFDGFPMFTRDGKRLVFASNRNGKEPRETNVFVADWKD